MSEQNNPSIEQYMEAGDKKEKKAKYWPHFVESDVLAFFNAHDIEKMTIENGDGGKAKLTRTKDNGVRIDLTSSSVY